MEITIKFFKSSSKYYGTICNQAEYFDYYVQNNSENTIVLSENELREKSKQVHILLETIQNWSKTQYYIDKNKASFTQIQDILRIFSCEEECDHCMLGEEGFCYGSSGWGCKYLTSIALRQSSYYTHYSELYWFDFGKFDGDVWSVNKHRISEVLAQEAHEKRLNLCSHYSEERVHKNVNALLDKIVVTDDGEWEYKYREAPLGMTQTDIIGVKPKGRKLEHIGVLSTTSLGELSGSNEAKDQSKSIPTITFSDIGGIDDIIQQVREVIELPLIAPSLLEHYGIKPHKGILLYGPPGCGKTLIAKAVANEIKAHFITVNGPEILNKFVGESENNLRNIFSEAQKNGPSIIYFDEFDSISATRDADDNPLMATVVNQLLTLMDGMNTTNQVCCIASTNRIDMIDAAIKRPGRFDYVIEIQRPSEEGCKAIFRIHTSNMPIDENFNRDAFVEKYLLGCTGAEIAFVVSEAAYNSIRRTVDITKLFIDPDEYVISDQNIINEMDFIKAANELKNSRKRADTAQFRNQH